MFTPDAVVDGYEAIPSRECLRLLSTASVGRVGMSASALPVILPVNYVLDGDHIVFRTGAGAKLAAALRRAVVCFEVDHTDATCRSGWSVLVTGVATTMAGEDAERARALPLDTWHHEAGHHYVAVSMELVSGRRVGPVLLDI